MKSLSAGPSAKFSLLWFKTHLHKTNEQIRVVEHVSIFYGDQEKDAKEHEEKPNTQLLGVWTSEAKNSVAGNVCPSKALPWDRLPQSPQESKWHLENRFHWELTLNNTQIHPALSFPTKGEGWIMVMNPLKRYHHQILKKREGPYLTLATALRRHLQLSAKTAINPKLRLAC